MFQFGSRTRVESESSAQERYKATATNGVTAVAASPRELGAVLRERREAMGISLAEAEAATRIRQKYIAALEADEWHLLPGEVVGRGFLRNYSVFLGLEPYDVLNRRRTTADPSLASVLSTTSAGSDLPPVRQVDYRPKDVDLREENEVMETRELRLAPILTVLGMLAFLALFWFGRDSIANGMTALSVNIQEMLARASTPVTAPAEAGVENDADVAGIVNPQNTGDDTGSTSTPAEAGVAADPAVDAAAADAAAPGSDPPLGTQAGSEAVDEQRPTDGNGLALILVPTATPTPGEPAPEEQTAPDPEPAEPAEQAAAELPPLPTPTPIPAAPVVDEPQAAAAEPAVDAPLEEEPSAEEEAPEEVAVVPAACADLRAAITSPGVGQPLSGVVPIIGTASHEAFQYYKLEYAPGADAAGGYVYFDGGNQAVVGGQLGSFNTTALPNGPFTLQIVVVDQTGNFPPPCRVTVTLQN